MHPSARSRALIVIVAVTAALGLTSSTTRAQDPPPNPVLANTVGMEGAPPQDAGGARLLNLHAADVSSEQMRAARERVRANIARLRAEGKLAAPDATAQVSFIWPLTTSVQDSSYYGIANFIDHDPAVPNHLLDYNNGTRTYDLSDGYNHDGTDIFPWPFPWNKLDQNLVKVVAAAAGIIAAKDDGNFDRSCSFTGAGDANYVILTHSDGSESWYWHMKNGSVTTKSVGQSVAPGEVLGVVASSGFSTGPHLHFEVRNASEQRIDPWAGPANNTTQTSWWQSQKPYYQPNINKLTVGFDNPKNPNCSNETPNEASEYEPGSTIYLTAYYRDQFENANTQYKIIRPDATNFTTWNHSSDEYYSGSWWWWSYIIPSNESGGAWKFSATYQGVTSERVFYICKGAPTEPTLTAPDKNATVGSKTTLKWTKTPCAGTYNVLVREGSKKGPDKVNKTGLTKTKLKVKNLTPDTVYFWRVTACDGSDCTRSKWLKFSSE